MARKYTIGDHLSKKLGELEDVLDELQPRDQEFVQRMTQCELDGDGITSSDVARILSLHTDNV